MCVCVCVCGLVSTKFRELSVWSQSLSLIPQRKRLNAKAVFVLQEHMYVYLGVADKLDHLSDHVSTYAHTRTRTMYMYGNG